MLVTKDELSLPIAVADSIYELAKLRGRKNADMRKSFVNDMKPKVQKVYPGHVVVDLEEEDLDEETKLQDDRRRKNGA